MATIKPYLDTRRAKENGTYPLVIAVRHLSGRFFVPLKIYLSEDQWTGTEVSKKHPQFRLYNIHIRNTMSLIEAIILGLQGEKRLASLSCTALRRIIEPQLYNSNPTAVDLTIQSFTTKYIETILKKRTQEVYQSTLNKINTYTAGRPLRFEEITLDWLNEFVKWMDNNELSPNGKSFHLRNLRAIFNRAIDRELIGQNLYPFRRFRMPKQTSTKRSLTLDQLKAISIMQDKKLQKYIDVFMLTFYLIGINLIDLLNLKNIENGRIEYYRAKTGKFYSIEVLPEAMEIINKYRGQQHLLSIGEGYSDYRNFTKRISLNLKKIGSIIGCDNLTTYYARHSWATIAASLDIPKETIAAALGHEIGSPITSIYIDFDRDKIDAANKRVVELLRH